MILNFNSTQLEIIPSDDSYRYRTIMGEHALTLMFSLSEYVDIPVGAYCTFENETYTLEKPLNVVKKHSRHFDYTLIMEPSLARLKKYKLKNIVDRRLKFNLTAKPIEHIQQIVDNLNLRDSDWIVGSCIDASEKLISYNHNFCLDALNMIASTFETEWEINQKTISLKKVEYNKESPLPLSYGRGKGFRSGVGRSNEEGKKAIEILYVQGGERNIDFSKYSSRNLILPKSQQITYEGRIYETDEDGYSIKRADKPIITGEEDSLDLSNIYPGREGTITQVISVDIGRHFYDIIDTGIPENLNFEECLIAGNTMTIIFQSGILAGREFEVKYTHSERKFEIVTQEMDGITMPDEIFKPAIGDKYAIFNMMLPAAYICDNISQTGASWDMFREAVKYFYENENPGFSFTGELDSIWAKKQWLSIKGKITLGGYIQFTDDQFQTEPILVRITGIKDYINNPYAPVIELSNSTASASFSSELKKMDAKEVLTDQQHQESLQFTRRSFRSAQETIQMLQNALLGYSDSIRPITVQTMALLVGDESLQFRWVNSKTFPEKVAHLVSFNTATKVFTAESGIIQHMTLGIDKIKPSRNVSDFKFWDVSAFSSSTLNEPEKAYYFYIKANKTTESASFILSETSLELDPEGDFYYFLMGILNSELDDDREFASLYGFSEILPGRITTNVVATDTLLAEQAKLANWTIRNSKITSTNLDEITEEPLAVFDGSIPELSFQEMGALSLAKASLGIDSSFGPRLMLNSEGGESSMAYCLISGAKGPTEARLRMGNISEILIDMRVFASGSASFTLNGTAIFNGFTKLGESCSPFKVKRLSGTTASSQGGGVTISHGLTQSKIAGYLCLVDNNYLPNCGISGCYYRVQISSSYFTITNVSTDSANILSKEIKLFVLYEE